VLFTWAGIRFAAEAWSAGESFPPRNCSFRGAPKSLIPLGFFVFQSIAEFVRSVRALAERREMISDAVAVYMLMSCFWFWSSGSSSGLALMMLAGFGVVYMGPTFSMATLSFLGLWKGGAIAVPLFVLWDAS
jgi:hypothetical protein